MPVRTGFDDVDQSSTFRACLSAIALGMPNNLSIARIRDPFLIVSPCKQPCESITVHAQTIPSGSTLILVGSEISLASGMRGLSGERNTANKCWRYRNPLT